MQMIMKTTKMSNNRDFQLHVFENRLITLVDFQDIVKRMVDDWGPLSLIELPQNVPIAWVDPLDDD